MKSRNLARNRKTLATVMIGLAIGFSVACFFLSQRVSAVNRTWDNGGGADQNWSNPLNWSGDTVPGSGDIAVFDAASGNSTIDGAFGSTIAGIQTNAGFAGTITQAANLIVGTSGFTQNAGTFNASSGTLTLQGSLTIGASATFAPNAGTLVFNGAGNQPLSLPASLTVNNLTVNKPGSVLFFNGGANVLNIAGTFTLTDGGLQDNTGVSTFNAQGPVTIAPTFDGGNGPLLISGAAARTITLPAGAGIPRTTVDAANVTLDTIGAGTITFIQPFAVTNCTNFTNGPVNFVFTQAFTFGAATNFTLGSGDVIFGSTYTQTGGTFSPGTGALAFNSNLTINGGTFNAPSGTLQLKASLTVGASATFVAGSGTLLFDGSGNQALILPSSLSFNNVTVNKPGSVLFFNGGATNLVITGTFTLTDGGLQDNTGVSTFNAQGPVSFAPSFDGGNGPLLVSGAATRTITLPAGAGIPRATVNAANVTLDTSGAGSITFAQPFAVTNCTSFTNGAVDFFFTQAFTYGANTNFTHGSGDVTFGNFYTQTGGTFSPGTGALTFNSDLTINGGTFNAPSGTLQLKATLTVGASATFVAGTGTLVFDGIGNNQVINGAGGTLTVNNLTVNKSNNNVVVFGGGATNLVILGTLTLTDGGLQDNTGVSTFNAQGPLSIAPTFDGGSGPLLISGAGTRTITLPAGAGIPRTTVDAANVTLDTSGAGTITFAQTFAVTNCTSFTNGPVNFVFTQAFTFGATTNFALGSGNVTFGSTYTQTGGTFSPGTGALAFNSDFTLTGGTFNAPSGTLQLKATLTVGASATFVAGTGTLVFDGIGNNQVINGPGGTLTVNNLTVNKSNNNVVVFGGGATNLVILGTLTLTDGGLQDNTGVSTFNSRGPISIASTFDGGSAPLSITGTANQTYTNAGGVNPTGIWTINKPSGSVTLASNLTLGSSQALNLISGTLDLGPSFNLTSGTLTIGANGVLRNFGTGNIALGGNLSNNGLVNINGGSSGCSDPNLADLLLIQSTDTNSRTWSGTGTFSLVDVEIDRQTVSATPGSIIAFGSSHLTNTSGFVLDSSCPVQITSHPTSQGGCPGGPVSFTFGANGTGLTFQWRKNTNNLNNGGNISGATSTTLSINPTTAGDVGSYDAVATSTLGITATSNAALLNLLAAPQITQSPSDATRCEGQSVTFNSNATGDGLSFQWRKNLSPIGGATGNSFTIQTVVAGDAGSYDVVVTGTCTPPATSLPAVLTVNTAPAITQEPTNQTACETGTASFGVGAAGSNLTFQWRKNSVPLVNSAHITGANTPTLTINSVVLADADTYDVVVSGSCNPSVTSQPRTLTVNTGTTISQQPTDSAVCEGATATFTSASNDATATVQWEVSTDNGANFTNVPGATSTTLSFTAANSQNGHKFRAVFNGACTGANTNAATLTVNPAPSIGNQPTNQTVCDGGSATFTVGASGSRPSGGKRSTGRIRALPIQPSGLTYQWRRNNQPLSNGGNILGADTPTLTINPATATDIASYDVVVSGSCTPPATSNPVSLSIDGYALSGTSQDFPLAGGSGSVNVITAASCSWTAGSNDSFVHITSGSGGTGNGTVNFSVDAAAAPRSGTLTIANKTFTVNQTAVASVIISEFRFHGIAGALDEFIEIYNNSNSAADISGYTIFALTAGGTPTLVFTVPGTLSSNTTVIPARGHYLVANNSVGGYSLSVAADGTYTTDIVDGSSIGLFAGPTPASNIRADSVGFDTRDALFFETAPLTPAGGITTDGELSFVRLFLASNGQPQDTNNNAADFLMVATNGGLFNGSQSTLGSPGPENLSSPILRSTFMPASLVDPLVAPAALPNRERNLTPDPVNNSLFGTLAIRRRFTNNTGQNVSQLRFRIMDITTFLSPGAGTADLRARTSVDSVVSVTGGGLVTVRGLTLDGPTQLFGGGYNSSLRSGLITLGAPLAPGASIDVEFLLGVQATGRFSFFVNVEAVNSAAPPP